eukprot:s450_g1.t1
MNERNEIEIGRHRNRVPTGSSHLIDKKPFTSIGVDICKEDNVLVRPVYQELVQFGKKRETIIGRGICINTNNPPSVNEDAYCQEPTLFLPLIHYRKVNKLTGKILLDKKGNTGRAAVKSQSNWRGNEHVPKTGKRDEWRYRPNTMVIDTIVRDSTTSQIILWTVGWDRLGNSLLAIKLCHELRNLSHEGANLLFQLSIFSSHGLKGPRGFIVIWRLFVVLPFISICAYDMVCESLENLKAIPLPADDATKLERSTLDVLGQASAILRKSPRLPIVIDVFSSARQSADAQD